jgi:N-acylneuraminate cytidylyltransferase
MISGQKVLGIIPARSGSKAVRNKNIRPLDGKPLLAWSALRGNQCEYIDKLIINSDSERYIKIAKAWGCEAPFVRPDNLATDSASSADVLLHTLKKMTNYEILVILQPTSPFRTTQDITDVLQKFKNQSVPACVSVKRVGEHPSLMLQRKNNGRLLPLTQEEDRPKRRQELEELYIPNGAVYTIRADVFKKAESFFPEGVVSHTMPPERSIDIDTEFDLKVARLMANQSSCPSHSLGI